jgi:lipoprotein
MQKYIVSLIAVMVFGLVSCRPDVIETEKSEEPTIETPVEEEPENTEEEPPVDPDINDWKPGTNGSTDLIEK